MQISERNVTRPHRRALVSVLTRHREAIVMFVVYGALAVVMTWPLATQLGTHLAGGRDDLMTHQWTFWWIKQALLHGQDPYYTRLIFYPQGISLLYHNIAWFNIGVWLPLQAVLGGTAAYNVIFIATFALNGFATYLLAREWTGRLPAAGIGGLVCGFWPYLQSQYDHPNMIVFFWIPLTLLFLKRALEKQRKRDALFAGVCLAMIGVTRWHLLIMGGVIIGLYVLYACTTQADCRTRRTLRQLTIVGVVAGLLFLPVALPVVVGQLTRAHPEDIFIDEQDIGQTDVLAYVLPTSNYPVSNEAFQHLSQNLLINQTYTPFLGYVTLALAIIGALIYRRRAGFWVLTAIVCVLLALGPQLRVNGQLYPDVPMPYRLVEGLFRILRKPDRFNVILALPIAMLATFGVMALIQRRQTGRFAGVLALGLGALILIEYRVAPFPTTQVDTPAWFSQLAQEPGDFAILDLPMNLGSTNKWYMYYQIVHGKALVEGRVSRLPREAFAFMERSPLLQSLRRGNRMDPAVVGVSYQLQRLADADVRYLVMHKKFARPEQLADWRDWLTFSPLYEDDEIVVYRTDTQAERDFVLTYQLNEAIGLIRATSNGTDQAGLIQVDARWASVSKPGRDYDVCFNLINAANQTGQAHCGPLAPQRPTSRWEAGEVVRGTYDLRVDPVLPSGNYTLTVSLADSSAGNAVGQSAAIGLVTANTSQDVTIEPLSTNRLSATWGDMIRLNGYGLQVSPATLELTVNWQALRNIPTSYKVFVHVVDPATNAVIAQDDSVPQHWTHPTDTWEPDEIIVDTITVPLSEVPPGKYQINIGMYDPATGERLAISSTDGQRHSDEAVFITDFQH
ncbi:hypothetical protein TFLX_01951 [Thermoflexales bacterium]|nr:hypothetical protein TFLX_01951 [Thermoflexales bacterium]